jgi:hypothetical protein
LTYNPSNFAAKNGTIVTFYFPKYKLYHYCSLALLMPCIVPQSLIPRHKATSVSLARIWPQAVEVLLGLILACYLRNNTPSRSRTIKNVGRPICHFISLVVKRLRAQPSFSSARLRVTVVSEWLGKCYFSNCYIRLFWMSCIDGVFRSAINAPTTGNTYAAYLAGAKALGSSEPVVSCSFVPLGFPCAYHFLHDFQISNTGAVTGGVGATPVPTGAVS